jgi:N-methylhydantoinase A
MGMDGAPGQDATAGMLVGIDVGGTFTDLVVFEPGTGRVGVSKQLSTPEDPSRGVLAVVEAAGVDLGATDLLIHGTTITTNAMLERRIARVGLVTTMGFRDVLELGRRTRPHPYGMIGSFTPIIPRNLRLEVPERIDARGEIVVPLDEAAFRAALDLLLAEGCEALVVHFLHSYRNPAHERRALEIAAHAWPNAYVTAGHALLSEAREYERGVTAAVNASVQPVLDRYLGDLRRGLSDRGYRRDFLVMNGNGGTTSSRLIPREAARTVMSGPASGVIAAAKIAARMGIADLITYDMGGTSTDVSLVRGGVPATTNETLLEYAMPVHLPMVDVHAIGSGGGSIARIDAAGLLRVGPESAGSSPGPICYGRGGTEPTISDANALLGRLDPSALPGVGPADDGAGLRAAFEERLGRALGRDAFGAAEAVLQVANLRMADAIRMVTVGRGFDIRDYVLFAFGGAGPLHACDIARELGVAEVVVPARPGLTNALGCALADLRHDYLTTVNAPLDGADLGQVAAILDAQAAAGHAALAEEAVRPVRISVARAADMQFVGQTHLIRIPIPDGPLDRADLQTRFEEAYFDRFRVRLPEVRARLVTVSTTVIGHRPEIDLSTLLPPHGQGEAPRRRPVRFGGAWRDTPVLRRSDLAVGGELTGPLVIEQLDATILIPPGDRARVDADRNLRIRIEAAP